jgi:hypothetical protein
MTWVVLCRALGAATSFCSGFIGLFMASRISGFGDIHQGGDDGTGLRPENGTQPTNDADPRVKLSLACSIGYGANWDGRR